MQKEQQPTSQPAKRSRLSNLFSQIGKSSDDKDEDEVASRQFKHLMHITTEQTFDVDSNALEFWKLYDTMMPELSILARSYLGIQATSCASERLFSKAGFIVSKYRTSLNTDTVTQLTFLSTNA